MKKVLRKPNKKNGKTELGVIYARYSSHNQRDCSIEQQVDAAKAYAEEFGIKIMEIYADRAVSGKTDNRPQFQKLMRDAQKGTFQYVISWKSNRIGRNMLQAMINESKLDDLGVRCLYVEEDFDDTAAGRFALRSMMNVNQFYSENMAEDIMRGLRDSASQAKVVGTVPFGYKKGEDKKFAINESEAQIVKEIYERLADGENQVDIINDLNDRGIKTRLKKNWSRSSFQTLAHNEKYIGIYQYADIVIPGGMPRIISDELFQKVQIMLNTKSNPQNNRRRAKYGTYLLTGKLFCGKCGAPMTGISGRGKHGEQHFYYRCQGKKVGKCDKKNVVRDTIEKFVAKSIIDHCLTDETIDWIANETVAYSERAEREAHLDLLQSQMDDTERALNNMTKAIEQGIITESTKKRLKELEAEQKDLKRKYALAKSEVLIVTKEEVVAGLKMFRDGDIEDEEYMVKLFDTFLVAVYIYEDDLKIVFRFSGDNNTVMVPLKDMIEDDSVFYSEGGAGVCLSSGQLHSVKIEQAGSIWSGVFFWRHYVRE